MAEVEIIIDDEDDVPYKPTSLHRQTEGLSKAEQTRKTLGMVHQAYTGAETVRKSLGIANSSEGSFEVIVTNQEVLVPHLDIASSHGISIGQLRIDQVRDLPAEQDDSDENKFTFDLVKLSANSGLQGKKKKKKNKKSKRSKTSRSPHRQPHSPIEVKVEMVNNLE